MSHEHITFDPELSAIEAALAALAPARSRIDRDLVMFRAGQASARRRASWGRAWIAAAACLGLIAVTEGLLLAHRPPPQVVERVVVVREPPTPRVQAPPEHSIATSPIAPTPSSPPGSLALGRTAYERLAEQVIRYGLDGLPAPAATARAGPEPQSSASRQMLQEELRRVLDPGDHS